MNDETKRKISQDVENAIWGAIKGHATSGDSFEWEVKFKTQFAEQIELDNGTAVEE